MGSRAAGRYVLPRVGLALHAGTMRVEPLFEPLIFGLVVARPEDPAAFALAYLRRETAGIEKEVDRRDNSTGPRPPALPVGTDVLLRFLYRVALRSTASGSALMDELATAMEAKYGRSLRESAATQIQRIARGRQARLRTSVMRDGGGAAGDGGGEKGEGR